VGILAQRRVVDGAPAVIEKWVYAMLTEK